MPLRDEFSSHHHLARLDLGFGNTTDRQIQRLPGDLVQIIRNAGEMKTVDLGMRNLINAEQHTSCINGSRYSMQALMMPREIWLLQPTKKSGAR
ncbi:hypothetical protein I5N04_13715 [Serratia marcescens]|nr:hypothetical protein [Serratia marcescens]